MASKSINPILKWLVPILILSIGFGSVALLSGGNASKVEKGEGKAMINNNASADTSVETLKTVSAELGAVQEQNRQIITFNNELTKQQKIQQEDFKNSIMQQVRSELDNYKSQLQSIKPINESSTADNSLASNQGYSVTNEKANKPESKHGFVWALEGQRQGVIQNEEPIIDKKSGMDSLLNPGTQINNDTQSAITNDKQDQTNPKPYYTLPVNATLTGAIAMQPIIGRIPINGKVPDPYTFKAIIGSKNLAANGIDVPTDVQGMIVSGIATGDMLGSCARGDITSATFVFQDGRISTTEAEKGGSLGTIAAANGNPCILGEFHSNAALYLGVTTGLGGIQGYANALSQAQTNTTVAPGAGSAISTIIKNGNTYALGQGGTAAATSAQRWWDQRVQNSFDFVFVPNVDPKTGEKLYLNINLSKEIEINYDPKKRKVFYVHAIKDYTVPDFD